MSRLTQLIEATSSKHIAWGQNAATLGELDDSLLAVKAEVTRMEQELTKAYSDRAKIAGELMNMTAERDALRSDAERYRWLKTNPQWMGWEQDFRPDEVERAIDAAMKEKP